MTEPAVDDSSDTEGGGVLYPSEDVLAHVPLQDIADSVRAEVAPNLAEDWYGEFDAKWKAGGGVAADGTDFAAIERPSKDNGQRGTTMTRMRTTLGQASTRITSGPRGWSTFYATSGSRFLRMANLSRDGVRLKDLDDVQHVQLPTGNSEGLRTSVVPGDVLLSITAELGKVAFIPDGQHYETYISQHVCLVRPNKAVLDGEFLAYYLSFEPTRYRLNQLNDAGAKAALNLETVRAFPIEVPSLPEQRKIAKILRTWDDAIERSETLVRAETEAFGALRRRLFVSGEHEVPLREVSERVTRKSDGAPHTVMTISAKTGFVAQADKYRRDMAGASVANYILLRRGDFAYNKGNSLSYPQGCIYALKSDSALVPNVYYSFSLRPGMNSSYYEHFFASGALNRQLAQRITSGVRGNGLLNLNADEFFGVKVPVPDLAAQNAAADALNAGARRIELLQRNVELLSTQKRGLMRRLITGQVRFDVAADVEAGGPTDD